MVADAVAALGGLDALVCLAGGYLERAARRARLGRLREQIATSLRPTVESVLAALPELRSPRRGDRHDRRPDRPEARAQRRAVRGGEGRGRDMVAVARGRAEAIGGRVNCVLPGTLDTAANRESMPDAKRDAWVEPRDLGNLIVYLCSPASRPLTGTRSRSASSAGRRGSSA